MADFAPAFDRTVRKIERFELSDHPNDYGKQTYAGISRRYHPGWPGWQLIDAKQPVPEPLVAEFYFNEYWAPIEGDRLLHQDIAEILFDWAVQRSPQKAVALALAILRLPPTLSMLAVVRELNTPASPRLFVCEYTLRRVSHRLDILRRDQSQMAFIKGWLARDLEFGGVAWTP